MRHAVCKAAYGNGYHCIIRNKLISENVKTQRVNLTEGKVRLQKNVGISCCFKYYWH